MDDAWVATSYLSDADILLASLTGVQCNNYVAENIIQSTAASVAVRGVMFGNRHPLSSRYHIFNIYNLVGGKLGVAVRIANGSKWLGVGTVLIFLPTKIMLIIWLSKLHDPFFHFYYVENITSCYDYKRVFLN